MIKLARFNIFTINKGHTYDVVLPVEMIDDLVAKVAEQVPDVEDIENALTHVLEDIGAADCVADFDEEFERESIDEDMTRDGIMAIVLGSTPPEEAEWIEDLNDL